MAEKIKQTYRVNYGSRGPKNQLIQKALIMDAFDLAEAKKLANEQLAREFDWFTITKVALLPHSA